MKIRSIEITSIYYLYNNDRFYKTTFGELLHYTIELLDSISEKDDFDLYNITIVDYMKIMDELTKKFSYKNKGV